MDWWPDLPRRGACEVEYRGAVKVLARGKCENGKGEQLGVVCGP